MRREQVLKICLNHLLTSDIEYIEKDEKSWLFYAADFSEGEISHEQFCIRFKNSEVAQEFKKAVTDAVNSATGSDTGNNCDNNNNSSVPSLIKFTNSNTNNQTLLMYSSLVVLTFAFCYVCLKRMCS